MEFYLPRRDSPIQVSCMFEMLIFKMTLVIKYRARFAFLFVHTVHPEYISSPRKAKTFIDKKGVG